MAPKPPKPPVSYKIDGGSSIFAQLQAAELYKVSSFTQLVEVCSSNNQAVLALKKAGAVLTDDQTQKCLVDMSQLQPTQPA